MNLKLNIVIGITILSLIVFFNVPSQPEVYAREKTNLDYLTEYAQQYGVSSKVLYEVIQCESNWKETAVGDHGLAYGLAQFHEPTFDMFSKQMGMELDYKSPKDQILVMAWAFSKGLEHHWTCYDIVY